MPILPYMETIDDSVPPCVHTIDESVPAGTLVELSPVVEAVIDDDTLLQLLNDPMDEPPLVASDAVDDYEPSMASTVLDMSDDEPSDVACVRASSPDHQEAFGEVIPRFVHRHRDWWLGITGVVDLRSFGPGDDATSGQVSTYCSYTIGRLVGTAAGYGNAVFKVGTAHDVFEKYNSYIAQNTKPFTHMFLLHRTCTKEGAGMLEALLIQKNWFIPHFVNKERNDKGGEGGATSGRFVYVIAGVIKRPSFTR